MKSNENPNSNRYVEAANLYGTLFVEHSRQQLSKLEPSQTDANVVCSRLLVILALAFHREYRIGGLHWSDPVAWKWIHLLRGVKAAYENIVTSGQALDPLLWLDMATGATPDSEESPLNWSFTSMKTDTLVAYIERTQRDRFTALRNLIGDGRLGLNEEERLSCLAAVETLDFTTAQVCMMNGKSVIRVLGEWICRSPPRVVEMLEGGHHAALAVYAHWLMMLVLCEDMWFVDNMGRAGIHDVIEAASCSPGASHVLQWPRQVLELPLASQRCGKGLTADA